MQFTVDPTKKAHWNDHWERDWVQGKVALGVVAACAVLLVVGVFLMAGNWGVETYSNGAPMVAPSGLASFCLVLVALALGSGFLLSYLRHRGNPQRLTSGESVVIEDGYFWMFYHRNADPQAGSLEVSAADLSRCDWWWDAKRRFMVIYALEPGAVRSGHYRDYSDAGSTPFSAMLAADYIRFYPFYEPDLASTLRAMGVPEVPVQEAERRTGLMGPLNI